jgi:serine/threonine-protein kinase
VDLTAPDGRELRSVLARPKLLALLAYLAAHAPGPFHRRDTLLALLWPEASDERARAALRQALYNLRNALGDAVLVGRGEDEVGLDSARFGSDVRDFEAALASGDREGALDLYRGDLLPGFFLPDAPEFERWLDERRSALRRRATEAACALVEDCSARGNAAATGRWGQRALELAPVDEAVTRLVIASLDRVGDRAGALAQHGAFARRLQTELGVEPSSETRALVEAIAARRGDGPPARPEADTSRVPAGGILAAPSLALEPPRLESVTAPTTVPRVVARHAKPRSPPRWLPLAAVGALGVMGVIAEVLLRRPDAALSGERIAMGLFENRTGAPELDAVGAMASDWAAGALRRADLVDVADPEVTRQALMFARTRPGGASESGVHVAAETSGARLVVSGSYDLVRDTLILVARITDAQRDVVLAQLDPVRAPRADPTSAITEMASRLTGAVATLLDARVRVVAGPGRQAPTYAAYRAYAEAEALFNQAYAPGQGALHTAAVQRYLEAYASDTTLVEALMRAAEADAFIGEREQADSLVAVVRRRQDELSPYSRRRLDLLLAILAGDAEARLRAARGLPDTPLDLAEAALLANRPRETIAALTDSGGLAYRRSVAELGWEWLDVFAARLLASAYHGVGDFDSELRLARTMRQRYPHQNSGLVQQAQALAALGRAAEVEVLLDSATVAPQGDGLPPWYIMLTSATELRAHGDATASRRAAERAVAWLGSVEAAESRSSPPLVRAMALLLAERVGEAEALADTMLASNPDDPNALGMLGLLAARRGDRDSAVHRLAALAGLQPGERERSAFRWQIGIMAALGDEGGAMALLREGMDKGWTSTGEAHRDPLLEPLWGRPAFKELIRPRG